MNDNTFQHGYATTANLGGKGYLEITQQLASDGDKISLSSVRNHYLSGLRKIALEICKTQGIDPRDAHETADKMVFDPRFQESIASTLNAMSMGDL
jgi:hypothetical protein